MAFRKNDSRCPIPNRKFRCSPTTRKMNYRSSRGNRRDRRRVFHLVLPVSNGEAKSEMGQGGRRGLCPCHGSKFDYAGSVFAGLPRHRDMKVRR